MRLRLCARSGSGPDRDPGTAGMRLSPRSVHACGNMGKCGNTETRSIMDLCGYEVGLDRPFFLIAGPCVIESRQMAFDTAGRLAEITSALGIPFIYKSSFDKANR